jgi:hypothetical protein
MAEPGVKFWFIQLSEEVLPAVGLSENFAQPAGSRPDAGKEIVGRIKESQRRFVLQ